jgi:hypothetical protein
MCPSKRWKRRPDVVCRELGQDTMLYCPGQQAHHVLNQTSARVWEQLARERTPGQLEQALRSSFDVPDGVDVGADVGRILEQLHQAGLIEAG